MAKAANGARLLFSSFALSLAVASSPACPTSEDALGECGATPTSAVLLQVDRGERLLTHADEEHDRSSKPNKQWTLVSDDNEEPVTMKDLIRRTEPLQDQIDDVQSDVKELRSDVRRQSGGSDRKKDDEDEGSKEDEGDERSSKGNEEGNEEGGERSSEGNKDKDGMNDVDKDYVQNNDDKGRSANFHIHKPASNEDREARKDWAWPESGNEEEASESDKPKRDQPDWGGIAPPPPWNGLEDVNAKDSGPDASWKGDGVGVASGKKYLGAHPYEKLMDVDYVIDSNPEPTRRRTKPEPTRRRPSIPKGDGNRRRTPAKSSPKNGEKSSPSKPKAPSRSEGKSPARSEGKSPSKKAPSSEPKTAPKSERKTAPKSSQEKRKSKASGKKSPASGKESAPTEGE